MSWVRFAVVGEGTLERALVDHLERLLIWVGATEVSGVCPDLTLLGPMPRDVESKIRLLTRLEPGANVVFVHRDADARDPTARYAEIEAAVAAIGGLKHVSVVPIQETEAWLLLDEDEIRRTAGKPRGRRDLRLPPTGRIESTASPKEVLHEALITASETTGRARDRFVDRLESLKAQMLRRLPVEGDIERLSAWVRLREECRETIRYL